MPAEPLPEARPQDLAVLHAARKRVVAEVWLALQLLTGSCCADKPHSTDERPPSANRSSWTTPQRPCSPALDREQQACHRSRVAGQC